MLLLHQGHTLTLQWFLTSSLLIITQTSSVISDCFPSCFLPLPTNPVPVSEVPQEDLVLSVLRNMTHILAFWSFISALQIWVWPFDPPPQALSTHDGAHPQNKAKQSRPCSTQRDCFVSTPPKGIVGSMHHLLTSRTYCGLGLSMGVTLVSCHADRSVAKGPKRSKTGQGIVAALKKIAFWIARNARMLNSGTSRLRCQTLTSAPSPVNANPTAALHLPPSSLPV